MKTPKTLIWQKPDSMEYCKLITAPNQFTLQGTIVTLLDNLPTVSRY